MTANPANEVPPFTPIGPNARPHDMTTLNFRQSADGVTFTYSPVYLHVADALAAQRNAPHEWGSPSGLYAPWPNGYNNTNQNPGGRGRLLGAGVASGLQI